MSDQLTDHYKRYPDLFIEEFLGVKLDLYQRMFMRAMTRVKSTCRQTSKDRLKQHYNAQNCPYDGNVRCIYAFGEDCLVKEVRCSVNCAIVERMELD